MNCVHNTGFVAETPKLKPQPDTPPYTPTAKTSLAHELVEEIRDIYLALTALSDLAPDSRINALLTRLVHLCVEPRSEDFSKYVLEIEGVEQLCLQLHPICAAAEGELERCWAQRIIPTAQTRPQSQNQPTQKPLALFPYHENYIDLSRLECSILEAFLPTSSYLCRPTPCNIAFIGSGPLPLTSFCISDRYPKAIVWNIDRDADALMLSEHVARSTGYAGRMRFVSEDVSLEQRHRQGSKKDGWRKSEVVFLAALVGLDSVTKLGILKDLIRQLEPGTLIMVRSARGLRRILYPALELSEELQRLRLEVLAEVHPWTKVVNSVVLLRVRER